MDAATFGERGGRAAVGLLLVQLVLGYEWLVSGLTKLVHDDFVSGLAAELAEIGGRAPGWYRGFLSDTVEPHASVFGYAVELGELLVGLAFVGAAVALLAGRRRLPARLARGLRLATGAAALAGLAMAVAFALANGSRFGLPLAADSFDEGVDLDTLMIGLQLAVLASAAPALRRPAPARARLPHATRLHALGGSR